MGNEYPMHRKTDRERNLRRRRFQLGAGFEGVSTKDEAGLCVSSTGRLHRNRLDRKTAAALMGGAVAFIDLILSFRFLPLFRVGLFLPGVVLNSPVLTLFPLNIFVWMN